MKLNESFKNHIINEIILPNYKNNIKYTIESRSYWSTFHDICKLLSYLLAFLASIFAFLSDEYPEKKLGFFSGLLGLIALKLNGVAFFALKNDHIKTVNTNKILKNLGIDIELNDDCSSEDEEKPNDKEFLLGNKQL